MDLNMSKNDWNVAKDAARQKRCSGTFLYCMRLERRLGVWERNEADSAERGHYEKQKLTVYLRKY